MTTAALATNPRVPPQSLEAEEAVLGGILLDNRAMDAVNEILEIEDFYRESHRKIFRALLDLDEDREPADVVTLTNRLQGLGELEAVGRRRCHCRAGRADDDRGQRQALRPNRQGQGCFAPAR